MILVVGGAFQGKHNFAENVLGVLKERVFDDFHLKIKDAANGNVELFLKDIFEGGFEVIICDEVGCGIVPLEKSDREWREIVGRGLCLAAKNCDEVWRVQCGIGTRIK